MTFPDSTQLPELSAVAQHFNAHGGWWEQTFVGVAGELYARRGDWDLTIPFHAGSDGGAMIGVSSTQPVTAPLCELGPGCMLIGRRTDGSWLCNIEGTRVWATRQRR